jgi:NAD-dependent SIR2 family protein deacetylase
VRVAACTVISQYVDALHQDAGTFDVIELHGNIRRNGGAAERCIVAATLARDARSGRPRRHECELGARRVR